MNKKTLLMIVSLFVFCITTGYALLSQNVTISGTSHVDSNWDIEITDITLLNKSTSTTVTTPTYTSTTASFDIGLNSPGDYAEYRVEISNLGSLDALVDKINTNISANSAITHTITGISVGDVLEVNQKQYLTIRFTYNSNITSQPENTNKSINLNITYVQRGGSTINTSYEYQIGDKISYAGSNWYVMKNSPTNEDYVTLLKENVLTAAEIGDAYSKKSNQGVAQPNMAYYWDDDCHGLGTYGTDTYSNAGDYYACQGHNDYDGSKIRGAVEGYMAAYLDELELKTIDEHKIRLIKVEDLVNNLGWASGRSTSPTTQGNNVPEWIYNFGQYCFYTMSPFGGNYAFVVKVDQFSHSTLGYPCAIRPVINLLKSAI